MLQKNSLHFRLDGDLILRGLLKVHVRIKPQKMSNNCSWECFIEIPSGTNVFVLDWLSLCKLYTLLLISTYYLWIFLRNFRAALGISAIWAFHFPENLTKPRRQWKFHHFDQMHWCQMENVDFFWCPLCTVGFKWLLRAMRAPFTYPGSVLVPKDGYSVASSPPNNNKKHKYAHQCLKEQ